jgi:hypothetical protein
MENETNLTSKFKSPTSEMEAKHTPTLSKDVEAPSVLTELTQKDPVSKELKYEEDGGVEQT